MPDLAGILGIGGPAAILGVILLYGTQYLINRRKEKRADRQLELEVPKVHRESESGIVETTQLALRVVREQMTALNVDMETIRQRERAAVRRIRELESRVDELEDENRMLRMAAGT